MKYIPYIKGIKKKKLKKIDNKKKGWDNMKFAKGLIIGGLLTTGVLMMYNEKDTIKNSKKKMMKKGKQFARKMGII